MRRWLSLIVVLVPLCLLLAACGTRSAAPPDEPPGVTGLIAQIAADEQGRPRILVGQPPEPGIAGLAWVTVTAKTTVLRATDKGYAEMATKDLAVGMNVKVWFDGPVMKSLPLQGGGLYIVVGE